MTGGSGAGAGMLGMGRGSGITSTGGSHSGSGSRGETGGGTMVVRRVRTVLLPLVGGSRYRTFLYLEWYRFSRGAVATYIMSDWGFSEDCRQATDDKV